MKYLTIALLFITANCLVSAQLGIKFYYQRMFFSKKLYIYKNLLN